jgi:hypothetical protein
MIAPAQGHPQQQVQQHPFQAQPAPQAQQQGSLSMAQKIQAKVSGMVPFQGV